MERWYGADYRSLQNGLHFLNDLRAIVATVDSFNSRKTAP